MRIRFVRHATFEVGGQRVMVDPMLAPAGANDPVANTPNQRRNPLIDLPELHGEKLSDRVKIPADGETFEVP